LVPTNAHADSPLLIRNPEFLREGTAVADFLHPDRIVVGADSERAAALISAIYMPLTTGAYYAQSDAIPGSYTTAQPPPLLKTSTKSAEIIKHASNAFLALKISFINAVSNLCEATDANIEQVARGIGLDSRIGPKFLRPGIGYGGSCFPKDVVAFRTVAEQLGIDFSLLAEVERINVQQKKRFLSKVRSALWTLRGKRVAVLGLAFKGETDDIRESPAIDLVEMLIAEGCNVAAFDPAAMKRTERELPAGPLIRYAKDAYDAATDVDALLILTDWSEFAALNLERLYTIMRYPIVVDGRNMYEPRVMLEHRFTYLSIGRPAVYPVRDRALATAVFP
jgi:UDPglucose 6-dehydrogenase